MAGRNGFGRGVRARLLFARAFFKHPRMLGSFVASSRFLADRLLNPVDWDSTRVIVEYGPGLGNITSDILARMHPDATLISIECNPEFVTHLRGSIRDPRLRLVEGSAAGVAEALCNCGLVDADLVIAGIPFTTIPVDARRHILTESHRVLRPNGKMLVYQFTRAIEPDLRSIFGGLDEDFEFRNILPARIFACRRASANGDAAASCALAGAELEPPRGAASSDSALQRELSK
jgi:phospholipid N-methyltransferase